MREHSVKRLKISLQKIEISIVAELKFTLLQLEMLLIWGKIGNFHS